MSPDVDLAARSRPTPDAAGGAAAGWRWLAAGLAAGAGLAGYGAGASTRPGGELPAAAVVAAAVVAGGLCALLVHAWCRGRRAQLRARALEDRWEQREGVVAQRLADLEALKAELIAVVSHEFRTPLTSLTGYARTLAARMDELPPSAVHRCVSGIDHHATRLARLVHNVLAADGDVAVDPQAVSDLTVVTRHAAEQALETHANRVVLHVGLPPTLRARVDLFSADRIVGNLLDNAVKFAPAESVVTVEGCLDDGAAVLEVTNRLESTLAVDTAHMFEPFVQADSSETRPGEGLGLGLHVARRLTLAHGGALAARVEGAAIVLRLVLPAGAPPCRLEAHTAASTADPAALGS